MPGRRICPEVLVENIAHADCELAAARRQSIRARENYGFAAAADGKLSTLRVPRPNIKSF
jgi:hypothetical protein